MTRTRALAVCAALVAIAVYAAMWVGHVQDWAWLHTFDWSLLNAAHDVGIKHRGWVRFWEVASFVLGPVPLRVVGMTAALVAVARRRLRAALLLLVCLPLSAYVTVVAKGLAGRPRPSTALLPAPSTSFPSGHALEAMAGTLALLTVLLPLLGGSPRIVAVTVAALSVVTVGVARVALNVHHPSDVLAGWALGYLYFLLSLSLIRPPGSWWTRAPSLDPCRATTFIE